MAAVTQKKKNQVRQRNKTQSKRGKLGGKRSTAKSVNRRHGKSPPAGRSSRKAWNLQFDTERMTGEAQNLLYFCIRDLHKKVFLAAERLRKKEHHVSITASDVRKALEKIVLCNALSSISCKGH